MPPFIAGPRSICPGRHAACLLLLGLISSVYFPWTCTDQLGALDSDGPAYLMMALHYANGLANHSVAAIASSFTRFPPLYPLALSWSHAADDLRLAHTVTTAFFILALGAFYLWLCEQELPRWQACFATVACAALPGSWLAGLTVQSEYLYLLLSLPALASLAWYENARRDEALYLAALAVTAAMLTRSIGLMLLPALAVGALHAPRRSGALALCIALLPPTLWSATHRQGSGYLGSMLVAYHDMAPRSCGRSCACRPGPSTLAGCATSLRSHPAYRRCF